MSISTMLARTIAKRSARSVGALGQTRTFAKKKAATKKSEPAVAPKELFGVHGRYATALFLSASKAGTTNKVEKELANFAGHADSNIDFARFLKNPTIRKADKKQDIAAICAKGTFSNTTSAFLGTLAENGRLGEVSKINDKFAELMRASRGEVLSVVTSADELTKAQLKSLEESFKASFLQDGETLIMDTKVNPEILGGLQVQIGDKFMDLSVASKVNRMHKMLAAEL
jgi:F-type H+-transporting ATPase subunit O